MRIQRLKVFSEDDQVSLNFVIAHCDEKSRSQMLANLLARMKLQEQCRPLYSLVFDRLGVVLSQRVVRPTMTS
jgi:hypothetical protein